MIRWGVLGGANIAVERTIPAIARTNRARCVAIASRNMARAQAIADELGIERAHGSYEDLLGDPDIEAVYIPLPNQLHAEWSKRALEAGKAVLCEKPLCLTTEDVRGLIGARDLSHGLIEEALVFRNHPQWTFVGEVIASGRIGRPLAVQATIAKQFLDPDDIRNQPGLGGGATYDLGTYVIAACNLVFRRPPKRVLGTMDLDADFGIDRLVTAILDYGGAHASFAATSQGGTAAWGTHQQFSILASSGWLRCNFPFAQARPTGCAVEIGDSSSVGAFATEIHEFPAINQYELQIERFSRLVAGQSVQHWPIEDSLLTLEVIEGLFRSVREGAWVDLSSV